MRLPLDSYRFTNPFAAGGRDDRAATVTLMRRVGIAMYGIGGLMVVLAILTGGGLSGTRAPLVLGVVAAVELAYCLYFLIDRDPPALALLASPFVGILCVGVASSVVEIASRPTPLYYLWALVSAAFFLRARAVALVFAFFLATFTVVLVAFVPDAEAVGWWPDVVGVTALVTVLVYLLKVQLLRAMTNLRRAALTDTLTDVPNRAAFEHALDDAIIHAALQDEQCAVLSVDIDDFKQVNDRFGHAAGDEALRRIAATIGSATGDRGIHARIGGEEFAVVLPNTDLGAGHRFGEVLRAAVEREMADFHVPLTVSVGVAAFPEAGRTPSSVLLGSDRALYAAKNAGRNRVISLRGSTALKLAA